MASGEAFAKYVDSTLSKVLAVTLGGASAPPGVVALPALAEELRAGAGSAGQDAAVLLNKDTAEQALMARLSEPPAGVSQWPVHYLISTYSRATDELRSVGMLKDPAQQAALTEALQLCRQMAVSYAWLELTLDMFPQPPEARARGALQILDSLDAAAASSSSLGLSGPSPSGPAGEGPPPGGAGPMPAGFLEDLGTRFADEGLPAVAAPIVARLMQRVSRISVLGEYSGPLNMLTRLAACKPWAKAITQLPSWLPSQLQDGRAIESYSVLGPFFGVSALPDWALYSLMPTALRQPNVADQCFSNFSSRRPGDVRNSVQAIQAAQHSLVGALHGLAMLFLKSQDTREAMVGWLAAALNSNAERLKMQPNMQKACSDGFMMNVAGVLLRLCEPFIDPLAGKAWGKLDVRYACDPAARLRFGGDDTRLHATSEEVSAWFQGVGPPADGKYHFICECFFMAGRALQMGLKKGLDNVESFQRHAYRLQQDLQTMPGAEQTLEGQRLSRTVEIYSALAHCYEAVLTDNQMLAEALGYYRLSAAYQLRLASPTAAAGGPPSLPLPDPPPKEICVLPELFMEDLGEVLLHVGRVSPNLVEARRMEEFMVYATVFLGSPNCVRNAFLRGKLVEALHQFMPQPEDSDGRRYRQPASAGQLALLFEVHPLVIQHMVGSLLRLYIDIEITDRHNTFYEKFSTRKQIGDILIHLWNLHQHRTAWQRLAAEEHKLNVQFIHVLLNDSQHLLQEALDKLPQVQETERLQDDAAGWAAVPREQQEERLRALGHDRGIIRYSLGQASVVIKLMQLAGGDRAISACFFDDAVRTRAAKIVDFFLKYLTVPEERKRLRLKDPEAYGWHPKVLITELAQIHLCLYRARRQEWVQAVAADTDYYGRFPQLFSELTSVLRALGLLPEDDVSELERLSAQVEEYKATVQEEEEAFEDVPEEFVDQLLGGIMRDPVRLPSGNVVERSSIVQQLLSDPRDPYTRQKCTEDDLEPQTELKARIEAWVAEQRGRRMNT